MDNEYATIAHRWFDEVWNRRMPDTIDELLCSDVIGHGLVDAAGNGVRSSEQFKSFYHAFREAFPDIKVAVEDTVSEGDKVVALCRVTATHAGDGMGVAPTKRSVEFTGQCMMRIKDGKIAESWNNFDFLTLYQQIGLVTLPGK